ncbi:MAG: hypothetical protein DI536_00160 [Archangium gephyra]|uniref:ATPase AAA-type core domain-containing protein n=1 Tax=Archangium gephyra TaxID=48 RepID=A0A2W5U404_9BACT|nr:MAG: hypothetical protein DI536_00160 [Archangium gephyra]
MLHALHLKNVGPAAETRLEFAPRLNLFTGDNGLGKSFLLDVAWWALTRQWPHDLNPALTSGYPARPTDRKQPATISFSLQSKSKKEVEYTSTYSPRDEAWTGRAGRPPNPGLVIYAHADGGFSVWDPARNYWRKKGNIDVQDRLPGYVLTPANVWDGLTVTDGGRRSVVCNGLLADWSSWIRENGDNARLMGEALTHLTADEALSVGPLVRLSVDDARDIPSIATAYGSQVPVVHASSGVRRVLGLAYMLIWSWNEHQLAAQQLGEDPTQQVVLLFDEIESHLHPRWQRTILKSLMSVADTLHSSAVVQLIAATHSPLVLASAEPWFDDAFDAWFDIDLENGQVALRKREFVRHGEVSNWLTSNAFDLPTARSSEAEAAVTQAQQLLSKRLPAKAELKKADEQLRGVLSDIDPFWVRWSAFMEEKGLR